MSKQSQSEHNNNNGDNESITFTLCVPNSTTSATYDDNSRQPTDDYLDIYKLRQAAGRSLRQPGSVYLLWAQANK